MRCQLNTIGWIKSVQALRRVDTELKSHRFSRGFPIQERTYISVVLEALLASIRVRVPKRMY